MKRFLLLGFLLLLAPPAGAKDLKVATSPDRTIQVFLTDEKCADPTAPAEVKAARVLIQGKDQGNACYAELQGEAVMVVIEDGRMTIIPEAEFKPVRNGIRSRAAPQKQSDRGLGTFGVRGVAI